MSSWVSSSFVSGSGVCVRPLEALSPAPRGSPHTFKNCGYGDGRVLIVGAPGRAALMLEEIGAMVAGVGPLPPDGLAGVYNRHDTTLVPPLAAEDDEPDINKP